MDKQALTGMWDHMRQKYGMYLRALDAIPADQFGSAPIDGMRTPTQLVVHTSANIVRDIAQGMASGKIAADGPSEDDVAASLDSKDAVMNFARECWAQADAAMAQVGDEQLAGPVDNNWGIPLNGAFAAVIINDEFMHHRGQVYAYVRAAGGEPPFMWDFDGNPEGFGPAAS